MESEINKCVGTAVGVPTRPLLHPFVVTSKNISQRNELFLLLLPSWDQTVVWQLCLCALKSHIVQLLFLNQLNRWAAIGKQTHLLEKLHDDFETRRTLVSFQLYYLTGHFYMIYHKTEPALDITTFERSHLYLVGQLWEWGGWCAE